MADEKTVKKNDFVELDFSAKLKESGKIFDTTIPSEAEKAGIPNFKDLKSLKLCIGQGIVVKGLDNALIGKEVNKSYNVEVSPKEAFGNRNPSLVKVVSEKIFLEKEIYPQRGMVVALDGMVAKINSSSGGRVVVDFNNPLSGKVIVYDFKIKRMIADLKEKLFVLLNNLLGIKEEDCSVILKEKEAEIEVKNKELFRVVDSKKAVDEFGKRSKELLGIDAKFKKASETKKEEKKEENKIEVKKEQKKQ